jgi:hypothetical protein
MWCCELDSSDSGQDLVASLKIIIQLIFVMVVWCSLLGTDWILKYYLDELQLQRIKGLAACVCGNREKFYWKHLASCCVRLQSNAGIVTKFKIGYVHLLIRPYSSPSQALHSVVDLGLQYILPPFPMVPGRRAPFYIPSIFKSHFPWSFPMSYP